ncbi:MAG: tetratricopeptide repeat protein [Flammeovirgaceae bacterium]
MRKLTIYTILNRVCILLFLFCFTMTSYAQDQQQIDSLQQRLEQSSSAREKIELNHQLALVYRNYDSALSATYTQQLLQLSTEVNDQIGIANAHINMGWVNFRAEHHQKGIDFFNKAQLVANKHRYTKGLADSYNGLGACYWRMLKYDEALEHYFKALALRKEIADLNGIAISYNNIGTVLDEQKKYDSAIVVYQKALDIQKDLKQPRNLAGIYYNLGKLFTNTSKLDQAISCFEQAILLYQSIQAIQNLDHAYFFLAKAHRLQGHHPKALEYYLKSLKIRESQNNPARLSLVYNSIGILFYEQKEYREAISYYYKYLRVNQALNNTKGIATAYVNIALVHEHLQHLDSAEYYYLQCINLDKKNHNERMLAWAYNGMAIIRQDQKRFDQAEEWVRKAINIRMSDKNAQLAQSYSTLGKNYLLQAQYEKALGYYQSAAAICEEIHHPLNYQEALEGLSICYEKLGQISEALQAHKLFKAISDSLFNVQSTKALTEQSMKFQFDKEKHRMELENEKHALVQEEKLKSQTYLTYGFFAGFAAVLIIAFVIYRSYQQKQTVNHQLSLQNEEIKLQQEEIKSQADEIFGQNQLLTKQKETLERSYQDLQLLNSIGKDITHHLSITNVISIVRDKIQTLMDITEFGIGIYDDTKSEIVFKNYYSRNEIQPDFGVPITSKNRLSVHCLTENQEIWLNDIKKNYTNYISSLEAYQANELLNSMICLPLNSGKHKIGVLSVQSDRLNAYSQYHVSLLRNIATYTAVAIENANAYEQILALDQFKESMTGMIVHDLKNPLNAIIGLSTDRPSVHTQQSIQRSGQQMLNLVSNILDVYKFESTEMTINPQDHALGALIQAAWKQVKFLGNEKNIHFKDQSSPQLAVSVDFDLIERVMVNLLTNAIKYTPFGGKITISTTQQNTWIEIAIRDTGQGIPQDKIDSIFDKFQQAEARKSGQARSTGLGLTFCKLAIEAHGGSITVHSEENQGSVFTFTIPQSQSSIPTPFNQTEEIHAANLLTAIELEQVAPFIPILNSFKIYEASKINRTLRDIEAEPGSKK